MRIAVVGVGQELLGDDAAGLAVCRRLRQLAGHRETALIIPAGPAPENCTSQLRRFAPEWVVLVDAARMEAAPGTVRWIPWEQAEAMGGSSHTLPLRLLSEYLSSSMGCRVSLLGIQPAETTLGAPLSPSVGEAVESVARGLAALLAVPGSPGSRQNVLEPQSPSPAFARGRQEVCS
jgi:hydrogenase 3 maturation protease